MQSNMESNKDCQVPDQKEGGEEGEGEGEGDSQTSSDISLPVPPDGGYGWVVVMASFMCHLIADGYAFTFGVMFPELLDHFGQTSGKTAWIGSIFIAMPLITGPLASALTNRYGCRKTTIAGAIVSSIGITSSYFAPSVEWLCLTFGVIGGIGLSMVYVPAVVIVAYYFEKKRAFATGIAVAGSGIGTAIFAPLIEALMRTYSWRGACLVLGGIMLKMTVFGALFRPLDEFESKRKKLQRDSIKKVEESKPLMNNKHFKGVTDENHQLDKDLHYVPVAHSLLVLPTYLQPGHSMNSIHLQNKNHDDANKRIVNSHSNIAQDMKKIENGTHSRHSASYYRLKKADLMSRHDIFYRGSLESKPARIKDQGKSVSCPEIAMTDDNLYKTSPNMKEKILKHLKMSEEFKKMMKEMMDFSILRNYVFVYICISCMLLYMWNDIPYIFTPHLAQRKGIDNVESAYLISIIGLSSTVGQIVIGYAGDKDWIGTITLYNILTSIAGIITFFVPYMSTYTHFAIYTCAYGFFLSANYALTTIILVDLFGMEKLTNSYGVVMLAEGIANMFGPPLAGWISEKKTYNVAFYTAGVCIFISGFMLIGIPCYERTKRKHLEKQSGNVVTVEVDPKAGGTPV